jgi:hypothetical protein
MAAFVYGLARDAILKQTLAIVSGTLNGTLVNTTSGTAGTFYNPVLAATQNTDQFFGIAVPGAATATQSGSVLAGGYGAKQAFGTRTSTLGSLFVSGNTLTFTNVTSNALAVGALVIWSDSGTANTSPLVAYIDFSSWSPNNTVTPNGSSISFTFASTAPGILTI